jgi:hypothetical protein
VRAPSGRHRATAPRRRESARARRRWTGSSAPPTIAPGNGHPASASDARACKVAVIESPMRGERDIV